MNCQHTLKFQVIWCELSVKKVNSDNVVFWCELSAYFESSSDLVWTVGGIMRFLCEFHGRFVKTVLCFRNVDLVWTVGLFCDVLFFLKKKRCFEIRIRPQTDRKKPRFDCRYKMLCF